MSDKENLAPCRGCGVLSDRDVRWYEQQAHIGPNGPTMPGRYQRATCADCASLDFARAGVAVRACLRLIGRPETDDALYAEVLLEEGFDASEVLFRYGQPSHRSWSHIEGGTRRELKRLYVIALSKKVARTISPVPVPPPAQRGHEAPACLICGVPEDLDWHGYVTLPTPGGGSVRGCLCAANCAPVMAYIGAFGSRLDANAYRASKGEAVDLSIERIQGVRPWMSLTDDEKAAVTGRFSWVPEPKAPIEEQQALTVEALSAQVATLQAELALMRGAQG